MKKLLKLIITIFIIGLIIKVCFGKTILQWFYQPEIAQYVNNSMSPNGRIIKCPICWVEFEKENDFAFCSDTCKIKYDVHLDRIEKEKSFWNSSENVIKETTTTLKKSIENEIKK